MSNDLLVITTKHKLSGRDYERYYNAFVEEKAMGTILLPLGFEASVVPDDIRIKLETSAEKTENEDGGNSDSRTLRRVLLHDTESNSLCVIKEDGWIIATTIIDGEDLFMHSLNPALLDKEVKNVSTKSEVDFGRNVWDGLVYCIDI